jgi:hypothetical protein
VVSLLKKQDIILPDNRMNAESLLGNLRKRPDNNEDLKEMYYAQMVDNSVLPAASAHESNASSLNNVLEMGVNFLLEIFTILLRFRLHHSAISGDIT